MTLGDTDEQMRALLVKATTIAVVGLSANVTRPSHSVAQYMQSMGYRIIPVNPNETEVLGATSFLSLRAIPSDRPVDIVNVFRRPSALPDIIDDAISIGAGAIWLQLGVTHDTAEATARNAGLTVISDQCIKIEHARLIGMRKDWVR
jgi:predicted CoA-binding protein